MDQSADKIEPALHPKVRRLTLVAHQAIVDDRFGTAALPEPNLFCVAKKERRGGQRRSRKQNV